MPRPAASYPSGSTVPLSVYIANNGTTPDKLVNVQSSAFSGGWSVVPGASLDSGSASTSTASSTSGSGGPQTIGPNQAVGFGMQNLTPSGSGSPKAIVLRGLTQQSAPLFPGTAVKVTFTFANAGQTTLTVPVKISTDPRCRPCRPSSRAHPRRSAAELSDPRSTVRVMSKPARATKAAYRCTECGAEALRWVGRCPECQAWGSVTEIGAGTRRAVAPGAVSAPARPIGELSPDEARARPTGVAELDRVLGGGIVPGSVVLLAGEPGVGKSTLLLDVARRYAAGGGTALIVTGEESTAQVRLRAERIGAVDPKLLPRRRERPRRTAHPRRDRHARPAWWSIPCRRSPPTPSTVRRAACRRSAPSPPH